MSFQWKGIGVLIPLWVYSGLVAPLAGVREEVAGFLLLISLFSFIQPPVGPFLALLFQKVDVDSSKSATGKAKPQHSPYLLAGVT